MIDEIRKRFVKLYRRKAHLHHYTEVMPESALASALETVTALIDNYASMDIANTM
jgi:tubulin epsilon